jgi:hypothetical protein
VHVEPKAVLLRIVAPPKRAAGISVESVDELVHRLKNEAKAI